MVTEIETTKKTESANSEEPDIMLLYLWNLLCSINDKVCKSLVALIERLQKKKTNKQEKKT